MHPSAKAKYDDLEEMRAGAPVLWSIMVSKRTVHGIADHLIMTPAKVKAEVDILVADGALEWGSYMGNSILKIKDPIYKELASFCWRFREAVKRQQKTPPRQG